MNASVDTGIASRTLSHGLQATDNRIRRRSLQRLNPMSMPWLFSCLGVSAISLRWFQVGRMGALVRNIVPERRAELLSTVSEQLHIVGPARKGNGSPWKQGAAVMGQNLPFVPQSQHE